MLTVETIYNINYSICWRDEAGLITHTLPPPSHLHHHRRVPDTQIHFISWMGNLQDAQLTTNTISNHQILLRMCHFLQELHRLSLVRIAAAECGMSADVTYKYLSLQLDSAPLVTAQSALSAETCPVLTIIRHRVMLHCAVSPINLDSVALNAR